MAGSSKAVTRRPQLLTSNREGTFLQDVTNKINISMDTVDRLESNGSPLKVATRFTISTLRHVGANSIISLEFR